MNHIDYDSLAVRLSALNLNWITFEKLLGLSDPVTKFKTWEEVLMEMDMKDLYSELSSNTGGT